MQFWLEVAPATDRADAGIEEKPSTPMKKTGCACEMMTSTALEFPVLGPDAGGLLTVTLTELLSVGVLEPLVNPFCVAAAAAAVAALLPPPMNKASAPAIAAASVADCICSFARQA
jgi:hypothetical protein